MTKTCPFCGRVWKDTRCICGAYICDPDNPDKTFKEIYGNKEAVRGGRR